MSAFKDWLNSLTSKTTPVDADELYVRDSSGTPGSKKLTWANLKATLANTFLSLTGGNVAVPDGTTIGSGAGTQISVGSNFIVYANNTAGVLKVWNGGINIRSSYVLAWGSSGYNSEDTMLSRDAAGIIAQRNGTNAQTFRIYNTYTDASNYERGFMRWVSNVLEIGSEAAGTGTGRSLVLRTATKSWVFDENGSTSIPNNGLYGSTWRIQDQNGGMVLRTPNQTSGIFLGLDEMTAPSAPATNSVRIYAEDNGSGKTRLMALFATGSAVQIAIEP